jgi:hypothetical protein
MRKAGTDENNVQMSDVLCDFCQRQWTDDLPMIEGHHGSCVCGKCMTVAYTHVIVHQADDVPHGYKCTMCLEHRDDPAWASPMYPEAIICRRCIKLAAGVLHKDKDYAWSKPV